MQDNSLLVSVLTAVSIGLGCGTCCSPIISLFLSSYLVSHAGRMKRAAWVSLCFFAGKIVSVAGLCMAASYVGRCFVSENGMIGGFSLRLAVQIAMSCIGIRFILSWLRENRKGDKKSACDSCGEHKIISDGKKGKGAGAMFMAGFVYGASPCPPLIAMLGYSAALPLIHSGVTGMAFGLSSILTPVTMVMLISGFLSGKMAREIPRCIKWFRLASYTVLAVLPFVIVV